MRKEGSKNLIVSPQLQPPISFVYVSCWPFSLHPWCFFSPPFITLSSVFSSSSSLLLSPSLFPASCFWFLILFSLAFSPSSSSWCKHFGETCWPAALFQATTPLNWQDAPQILSHYCSNTLRRGHRDGLCVCVCLPERNKTDVTVVRGVSKLKRQKRSREQGSDLCISNEARQGQQNEIESLGKRKKNKKKVNRIEMKTPSIEEKTKQIAEYFVVKKCSLGTTTRALLVWYNCK